MADAAPQPRRTLSREACAPPRASAFAAFLSDGSDDEDEDDAASRALLRMQQQADDGAFSEAAFTLPDSAVRLTLQQDGDEPARLVLQPLQPPPPAVDVQQLVELVERASRVVDGQLELQDEPQQTQTHAPSRRRKTSGRKTESAFADFLSDESNSSDEDEDDADTRALLRMQQQADDRTYVHTSLKMDRPPATADSSNNSFRLTLAKPGVFHAQADDDRSGPRKLVEEAMQRESAAGDAAESVDGGVRGVADEVECPRNSDEDDSFVDGRPSFNDTSSFSAATGESFVGADGGTSDQRASDLHESLASRPPSFDDEGDSFFDEGRPSFSDEHSFTGGDSFTATDNSFGYRPSLPDDDNETPSSNIKQASVPSNSSFVDSSFVYRPSLPISTNNTLASADGKVEPSSNRSLADSSFIYRPTLPSNDPSNDKENQQVKTVVNNGPTATGDTVGDELKHDVHKNDPAAVDSSFVYRPTLPDDSFLGEVIPNTERTDISCTKDSSFAYRPTLPESPCTITPTEIQDHGHSYCESDAPENSKETPLGIDEGLNGTDDRREDGEENQLSFLSQTASSFIRSSDEVAFMFSEIDSSFRLVDEECVNTHVEEDSFSSVLTDSCASSRTPELGVSASDTEVCVAESAEEGVTKLTPIVYTLPVSNPSELPRPGVAVTSDDFSSPRRSNIVGNDHVSDVNVLPVANGLTRPPLSRQSSVSSGQSCQDGFTQQRHMTGTRESWRVSSLDFRESKHAFDEERGPLADHPASPRASAVEAEQHGTRLSSTCEERSSVASVSSSVASFHSQADFFVDDIQQFFSSVSSLSLDSRPSGDDSFANVAILGDDVRDQNERRSSDIISRDVREVRSSSISAAYPVASETLDRSYSDLVDVAVGLDRSFSRLVDRDGFYPHNGDRTEQQNTKPRPSASSPSSPKRQKLANESEQVFYRSIGLTRGNGNKATQPSRSASVASSGYSNVGASFSSSALLAAIKTRDARTETRSEETEAGDVALGALPPLAPPLKINLVPRGRGSLSSSSSGLQASPSISASPLAVSSMVRSSLASSTGTADRLDFTGVYRGSANSLEASQNNDASRAPPQSNSESKPEQTKQRLQDEVKEAIKFDVMSVKLARSISDSRMMQRESQRKVEDFFRRTYQKDVDDIDEREVHRWTNRKTRARTTVIQCVDDIDEETRSFAFHGNKAAKIIDLKNLRNGGKRPGWHVEDDLEIAPQQEENSFKHGTMGMTTGTTSTGTTATRSMPSDVIPMQHNYVISPQASNDLKRPIQKEKVTELKAAAGASGTSSFFLISPGAGGDDISQFGAISSRRANNVSLTPTLPRLSASQSPVLSPSPFVTSLTTPNEFVQWGFRASFTQRPILADRVQSLSASLASTLRRFLHGKGAQQPGDNRDVTSPQSQCTAPAALPRAYDHNGFYEAPFEVPGLNKPLLHGQKKRHIDSDRAWVCRWLVLATCAVLGLSLGAILVRIVVFNASVFNLSADEAREHQEINGELMFGAGVRWLLLPGHLFLRAWSAITTPLMLCYVATALADLVGCADKSALVLSFRSIGYALLLASLAAAEGVCAMWLTHNFGWFRGDSYTASSAASALSDAIGETPLPDGAVGLLCTGDGEYLQRLGHDVFACSNASLTLPLFEEVSSNSTGITDSGPSVFALNEVTKVLATPSTSMPYYPMSLGSAGNMTSSLLSSLTPESVASQLAQVERDDMVSHGGLVMFGLLLGYVCGKRILRLRRDAQAAMFESVGVDGQAPEDPRKSRHYIVGILMELQLALEWLIHPVEKYLAPLGFFSLLLGHVILHHREWRSFTSPMASLIFGVLILVIVHAVAVLPWLLKQLSSRHRGLPLLTTARAFAPTFLFVFTTNDVALSAPVTLQCYARVLTVTRSSAQLATSVAAALTRNARALYLPLLVLWLLETSTSDELQLSTSDYFTVGVLSLLSSFCGGSTRLTLAIARTLWSLAVSKQSSTASILLPPTMPLLIVCDVVLSRVANVVTVVDHLVLAELAAQHWDETVVHRPRSGSNNFLSPSPLDDSQIARPPSSALLSSVYL
ncbi:unnamed protein product [Phytophthora lilii]|uniref:Unnamed protein product n=1 Tax=Phytophthora lilii TaxID=2077276 RepID=A0A9W6U2E1_9STRA|nr:unnamed protein product [Phytophthora lilii]